MNYRDLVEALHSNRTLSWEGEDITNWETGWGACPSPKEYEDLKALYESTIAPLYLQFGADLRADTEWTALYQTNPDASRIEDFLIRMSDGLIQPDATRIAQFQMFWGSIKPLISPALLAKIRTQAAACRLPSGLRAILAITTAGQNTR